MSEILIGMSLGIAVVCIGYILGHFVGYREAIEDMIRTGRLQNKQTGKGG